MLPAPVGVPIHGGGSWSPRNIAARRTTRTTTAISQSAEQRIVAGMGGIIYGPYTGIWFASTSEADIEHIVARSEAHDSGLCAADAATRRQFAGDLLNLTLASPAVNRSQKSGKDAAEWLPGLTAGLRAASSRSASAIPSPSTRVNETCWKAS